jgi:pimeloyl-ACP methyl ester carboxylesterase
LGPAAHAFDGLASKLVDRFRVLVLSPRAHGESATPDTIYTVGDAAEDIRSLLDSLGGALLADVTANPKEYGEIAAPALALWAEKTLQTHYFWLDSANPDAVEQAREYLRLRRLWEQRGVERFEREMAAGEVVVFPGHHWVFITDEERVLGHIRSFIPWPGRDSMRLPDPPVGW